MNAHFPQFHSRGNVILFATLSLFASLLIMLALFSVGRADAIIATDTNVDDGNQIFLPIISAQGAASTTPTVSPFETLLNQALQRCAAIAANQACLGNGAAAGFVQVGDSISLTSGMTMAVRSASPTLADWTVVVMRVLAPGGGEISETVGITQLLDVVAVGNVDFTAIHLITSTIVMSGVVSDVVSDLPSLRFVNQPVIRGSEQAPSGLIVINPAHKELLSLDLNGAAITLGSTAFLQAQPGAEMVVNLREGSALVQAAGESSAVVAGSQVKVALNAQGVANAAPSQAATSPDDDLLIPSPPSPQDTFDRLFSEAFTSMFECTEFKYASRVYTMYYYLRQLNTPQMRSFLSAENWAKFAARVERCARFEVIFDSTLTLDGPMTWLNQVHSDGTFIQFDIDGKLVARATSPVRHLQLNMSMPVCTFTSSTAKDGTFAVEVASLKLFYNTFKISLEAFPHLDAYTATFTCPSPAPPVTLPWEFNNNFVLLHPDLWLPQPIYVLNNEQWKVTGRQIFAEAIFADRNAPAPEGTLHGDSYFILRHAPVSQ